ncbi:MAG: type II secretion system protein F [Phycisphaeraceae bacterium]|nr:MAG: type II secretion system protein F [Phycisphaeraceae bacterium]
MKFQCEAYTKSGDPVSEIVEAATAEEAIERLRRRGMFVLSTSEAGDAPAASKTKSGKRTKSNPKQLAVFAREMSVLISTGTPVMESLVALERQTQSETWKNALARVRAKVEEGMPLSQAMADQPGIFDPVSRSLVAAGESSGKLDTMFERLAVLSRRQAAAHSAIMGAMIYPALLLSVAGIVLVLMLMFVLPRFGGLFETLDTPLPPTTKILMVMSDAMLAYWWGIAPALVACVVGGVFWARSAHGKAVRDTAMVRMPKVGVLARAFATARIARLLGVLLESKVPLMEALALTKASMTNANYARLIEAAETQVTKGESMSAAFGGSDLVAHSVCEAMRNGEQSGRLGKVLLNVADYLDEENETVIKSLSTLIEPVIMISLGLVVGFVAVSMFLPLFDLTASAGGGAP